jgi:hypothetical protein
MARAILDAVETNSGDTPMAMTFDWPRARTNRDWSFNWRLPRLGGNAALDAVLAKKDDRLLADAGLTRERVLGAEGYFRQQWSHIREPWTL